MKKSIVKRLLEDKNFMRQYRSFVKQKQQPKQLSLFEDVTDSMLKKNKKDKIFKPTVEVKAHQRKTKTGKLSLVNQYQRRNNFLSKFKKLKEQYIKEISSLPEKSKICSDKEERLKIDITKLVIKELGLKDNKKIKKNVDIFLKNVISSFKPKMVKKQEQTSSTILLPANKDNKTDDSYFNKNYFKKLKTAKSKFAFGYLGTGDIIEKEEKKLSNLINEGYTLYNQNISQDKNWSDTLKRKNLKILKIGKQTISDKNKFETILLINNAGKLKVKKLGILDKIKILKIIKEGI